MFSFLTMFAKRGRGRGRGRGKKKKKKKRSGRKKRNGPQRTTEERSV